ncbi:hypothetical protein LCGC14_0636430 [marine sediment metagenome]|uniref:Uncharacterized protein n=1 Tax=marine sediment metagenome TaxID=412755 RepID=A0A0F9U8U0_9ZZZZ
MSLAYVRIIELTVSSIKVLFNDDIDTDTSVNNILVTSAFNNVSNPEVKSVNVDNDVVTVTFSALFPNVQYKITFTSTDAQNFQTINGEKIFEDGNRNSFFITSPGEDENDIRDAMFDDVSILYETGEPTLVRDLISSEANDFQKASNAINTTKSANYLSVLVTSELKTRDDGPIDYLDNGGAFEILKVSSSSVDFDISSSVEFSSVREQSFKTRNDIIVNSVIGSIGLDPISIQAVDIINELVSDDVSESNYFDGLFIKVSKMPVIQVISVSLLRDEEYTEYDIEEFGYTLKSNRYDSNSSSINTNLNDNEIELSSSSITGALGGFLIPRASDKIYISYVYKKLGRNISTDGIAVSRLVDVVREAVPAIVNKFALSNAPIVSQNDVIATLNGTEFLNPQSSNGELPFTTTHPSFTTEIPYDILRFPAKVGEYSINYETGDVYVFGEDINNEGTGENFPVANYTYRETFVKDIDFTFNDDRDEIAINSTRNLPNVEAKISFKYTDTFAEDTDYRVLSHIEVLNERVNNKLISAFKIETENFPITNVFRIFNETTGELYSLDRFNDTSISFTGRVAPKQQEVERELAQFARIPQEVLLVSDELTNSSDLRIFKIALENSGISDSQERNIGSNFDTSVLLSDTDSFIREFFYEDRLFQNVSTNINRLQRIGDFMVDYTNGIIYVSVSTDQGTDLGDISYKYKKIKTFNEHILSVNNIYRSQNALQAHTSIYNIGTVTDTTVSVIGIEQVGERFINNNITRTLLIGTYQSGEDGITLNNNNVFTSYGAVFSSADIGRNLIVGSASDTPIQEVDIVGLINDHEVTVSPNFNYTKKGRVWAILDLSSGSDKTITLNNNIISVSNIYTVEQIGTLPATDIDGYFNINRDSIDGNVITLGASNALQVGDAIVVNYNSGSIFVDYNHLRDNITVSYEYGNNSLDWSISSSINTGDQYYVTYKYGALRDSLLLNFGSLTQVSQLTSFSPNFNRETYRDILGGTLQSFVKGPTITSLEKLVESFTDVTPNITESIFNDWVLGRDNLHLRKLTHGVDSTFDLGKFDNGIVIENNQGVEVPALAHLRLNEGTLETWVRPNWKGIANDANLTFEGLLIDGYADLSNTYIGFSGANPSEIPFTLNVNDTDISVLGEPSNINEDIGFFIWFDEFADTWNIRWRENTDITVEFDGSITTNGEFYNLIKPIDSDGYINEVTDIITSTTSGIDFTAFIDGYDIARVAEEYAMDGISFSAGLQHYIFDMANDNASNRMSLFKDGTGYLNFQIFDNRSRLGLNAGFYNISKSIRDWESNSLHHIAISWKLNSSDEQDEMHLFVDGQEVQNLFKFGGNPKSNSSFDFGDVAEEMIISNASIPIMGGFDGSTESGSNLFMSESADFTSGVSIGHSLYLLDDTNDGIGDPNFGLAYTITGVTKTTLLLDRALTLTLGNLSYSVNSTTVTVTTPINIQSFIVVAVDGENNETELYGIDADNPDYSISRGSDNSHIITIHNRVEVNDSVIIRPLGLVLRRCRKKVYSYGNSDELRLNSPPPVNLSDVQITKIILNTTLISTDRFVPVGMIIGSDLVTVLQSDFDTISDGYIGVCQPSNQSSGKKLSINVSGNMIDFSVEKNEVIISGLAYSGATSETIIFTESGTIITDEYWKNISLISVSIVPINTEESAGVIEIREYKAMTVSENNGDMVEVVEYSNGIFRLELYGTGGIPFILDECTYEIDYPTLLKINIDSQPDTFFIGSDFSGDKKFNGIIDEFRVLDTLLQDTRVGETVSSSSKSITIDYNISNAFSSDNNTLLLAHFNNIVEDSSVFKDKYDVGFEVDSSVNSNFGSAIRFSGNKPYIINNALSVFNPSEGTIEFWISPLDDSRGDPNYHYYVDMSAFTEEQVESSSSVTVIINQRAREIESIRLVSDVYNTGTNYFTGGSVSNVDRKTITLGIPLPTSNVLLKVSYVPLNNKGDRVSIFRDPNGRINFFVKASDVEHMITVQIPWQRHTWHRIMVMWIMNSSNNLDRLRLFVDGSERGTIKYGTGLIYGTGIIYGQAEVRPGVNRFLVDNIDLSDTFAKVYIGSDVFGLNGARALIDNIRFSSVQRLQSIKIMGNETIDINYLANTDFAIPVIEDINTTSIYDFDIMENDIDFLATVVNAERGIFRFKIEVIDSFDKIIGNTDLENLLVELIKTIQPAQCESTIVFAK